MTTGRPAEPATTGPGPGPRERSGTRLVIFLAVAFVLLAAFFLFVVSRAAPDPEGVPVEAPAAEPAIRQPGSTGGLAALVLSVGGVGIVGAIAAREVGRRRQPDRR